MPAKRPTHGRTARWGAYLCVVFLLLGPTMASVTARVHTPAAERAQGAVVLSAGNHATVTTTTDIVDGDTSSIAALNGQNGVDGAITLREALLAANNTATAERLTIDFTIPTSAPGYDSAEQTWTIALGVDPLPPLARGNVTVDGTTQSGSRPYPQVVLDGLNVFADPNSDGITITSAGNSVRRLTLINFYNNGIVIDGPSASGNLIAGCYIGTNALGTTSLGNGTGVRIGDGAHDNLIGGASAADRNLISGNVFDSGVLLFGPTTARNTIAGNWIGVDSTGLTAVGNVFAGVHIRDDANNNLIGGPGQGNLISGNDSGVGIEFGAALNTLAGNTIGLAADGYTPLGNNNAGVLMRLAAHDNQIGGASAAERNIISSNGVPLSPYGQGIYISDLNTDNNTIQGNYIGVGASGVVPAGNYSQGILITQLAQGNLIGGAEAGAGNVVAYNGAGGIRVDAPANQIAGNLVGVGADRATQLGNQLDGIRVGGDNNRIGPDNLIAYNQHSGITLSGSSTEVSNNIIESNARSGMCVIGPNTKIDNNTISGNGAAGGPWPECNIRAGVVISETNNALVTQNSVLYNSQAGITIHSGQGNSILGNSISGNSTVGIELEQGGNNNVAPPVIGQVSATSVSGVACPLCRVDIFTDVGDEGRYFVDYTMAQSDGAFSLVLVAANLQGQHLTATNTDGAGNTSPFAASVDIPPPDPTPTPGPSPTPQPSQPQSEIYLPSVHR